MEPIKKIQLADNVFLEIGYEDGPESSRNDSNQTKFCIREHRRYTFPNELNYDWDSAEEDAGALYKQYYVFTIDCYEHSNISFSLSGEGMQCRFDTSRKCGFIAVPKLLYGDSPITKEQAKELARGELAEYNQYLNGEVYEWRLYRRFPSITQDGRIYATPEELLDNGYGIYDMKDIRDCLNTEYHEKFFESFES